MTRRRILAVTTSPLPYPGNITDGPGYRMWGLLRGLAGDHDIRVLSLYESFHRGERGLGAITDHGIRVERPDATPTAVRRYLREWNPDILWAPWSSALFFGSANQEIPTILDYVGPGLLEEFVRVGRVPVSLLHLQLESFWAGDRFITTTERERFFLIGLLAASKRLSTEDFSRQDPLVHVVRMTAPTESPSADALVPRIDDALVVLVAGAFLPWYDYGALETVLRQVSRQGALRFLVVGGNPRDPKGAAAVRSRLEPLTASGRVQLHDLVPFEQRAGIYASADVGLLLPPPSVEDELSARTRTIDYLWAGLPLVTPGRDEYSALALEAGAAFRYEADSLPGLLGALAADRDRVRAAEARIPPLLEGPFSVRTALAALQDFLDAPEVTRRSGRKMRTPEAWFLALREMMRRSSGR